MGHACLNVDVQPLGGKQRGQGLRHGALLQHGVGDGGAGGRVHDSVGVITPVFSGAQQRGADLVVVSQQGGDNWQAAQVLCQKKNAFLCAWLNLEAIHTLKVRQAVHAHYR